MTVGPHLPPPLATRGRITLTKAELERWGEQFGVAAASKSAPLLLAISGELGTGKTTLTQAICRGYGVTETVASPTFALVHQYEAPTSPVFHLDLYRITSEKDMTNLGWDEIVSAHALVIVEWPERAGSRLPADHVAIALAYAPGDPDRRVLLAG